MKKLLLSAALVWASLMAFAQTTETVAIGANGADQVWYSLENGEAGRAPVAEWDMAFQTSAQGGSILFNAVTGNTLWVYPGDTAEWNAIDTGGISAWDAVANSDTSWSNGAFNADMDPADDFDMGWGLYNMVTHSVVGNRLFIMKNASGTFKKLWIESLASGTYTFRIADLDGSNETVKAIEKAPYNEKSFVYYNIANDQVMDREPVIEDWDLLFTRYAAMIPGFGAYPVSGILQAEGTKAVKVYPVDDPATFTDFASEVFSTEINTIGYDWKTYNMGTGSYEIADSTVYFMETQDGDIWKVVMTGYASSNTAMTFTKEKVQAVGIEDQKEESFFSVYPNPTSNKNASLAYALPIGTSNADLRITDPMGRTVQQMELKGSGLQVERIDFSRFSSGTYYITLSHSRGTNTQILIVR